jgi:hypothetical protein
MPPNNNITRLEFDTLARRLTNVEDEVKYHNKLLVVGNGDPPLKELGRDVWDWMKENKGLPETVRMHGRWMENVNKIGWAIILLLIGILVTNGYEVFFRQAP